MVGMALEVEEEEEGEDFEDARTEEQLRNLERMAPVMEEAEEGEDFEDARSDEQLRSLEYELAAGRQIQVIFRGTFWTRIWAMLSKEEERAALKDNCRKLESTVLDFFNKNGWNFRNRLQA